jgi:hypothetical protein
LRTAVPPAPLNRLASRVHFIRRPEAEPSAVLLEDTGLSASVPGRRVLAAVTGNLYDAIGSMPSACPRRDASPSPWR